MTRITTKPDSSQPASEMAVDLFDNWFDPIEAAVRERARQFIEELIRGELDAALARPRYGRGKRAGDEESASITGHRHGHRTRSLTGTFGPERDHQKAAYWLGVAVALPLTVRRKPPLMTPVPVSGMVAGELGSELELASESELAWVLA